MVATIIVAGVKIRTEFQLSLDLRDLPLLVPFRETDGQKYIQWGGDRWTKKHDQGDWMEGQANGMMDRWDISRGR